MYGKSWHGIKFALLDLEDFTTFPAVLPIDDRAKANRFPLQHKAALFILSAIDQKMQLLIISWAMAITRKANKAQQRKRRKQLEKNKIKEKCIPLFIQRVLTRAISVFLLTLAMCDWWKLLFCFGHESTKKEKR